MKDNETIKALESLLDKMRAYESSQASIGKGLVEDIISMYDRQKAEIERLQKQLKEGIDLSDSVVKIFKAEAIKEFWEKLKETKQWDVDIPEYVYTASGDNLLKEMTEQ